jgi:hypothetical protein
MEVLAGIYDLNCGFVTMDPGMRYVERRTCPAGICIAQNSGERQATKSEAKGKEK